MRSTRPSLLFVNQFYYPDVAATGHLLTDLAEFLAERGSRVTVFTSKSGYAGGVESSSLYLNRRNGVDIRRFRSTSFGRASHVGRIADYLAFYVQVFVAVLIGSRYDGVVFLTTPPLIGLIGVLARTIRGQRYAIWSMDLHPEAEFAAGMIRIHSFIGRALRWLARTINKRADFVIALGPFMKARILAEGVNPERIGIVPPWCPKSEIVTAPTSDSSLARILERRDRFVVMYSGNAGIVHDFEGICDAMRILDQTDQVFFLFVGDGPRRREIELFAAAHRLRNFAYYDYIPRDEFLHLLPLAQAHLISLRTGFAGISVPSKLYGLMASGRPALFVGPTECESAESILSAECGAVIDPAQGNAGPQIAETLISWMQHPENLARLGSNGRRAFLREYELSVNCARIDALFESYWNPVEHGLTLPQQAV